MGLVRNTLEEEDISLSESTIQTHPRECKYRQFTRCKPLVTFKNRAAKSNFAEKKTSQKVSKVLDSSCSTEQEDSLDRWSQNELKPE